MNKLLSPNARFETDAQDDGNLVTYDLATGLLVWDAMSGLYRPPDLTLPWPPVVPPDPPVGPLVGPHDPRIVRMNFGSLWDPVLGRWIFQGMYPSADADTRKRWREIAAAAGDVTFQLNNPTTPLADYHDQSAYVNWLTSGRMDHWNACAKELVDDGFTVLAYADSGDRYPGVGYHQWFFDSVHRNNLVAPNGTPRMICCAGHEIVKGGYSTKNAADSIEEIDSALAVCRIPVESRLIAIHTSDRRVSWGDHPTEADSPYPPGDDVACWRSSTGQKITHHLYQSALVADDDALTDDCYASDGGGEGADTHAACSRVIGDRWVDPHGAKSPDWFAGLPRRPYAVLFETNEERVAQGRCSRERMLEIARAFLAYGFTGYGCGTPDLLRDATACNEVQHEP